MTSGCLITGEFDVNNNLRIPEDLKKSHIPP
jgi:hypothetical protein